MTDTARTATPVDDLDDLDSLLDELEEDVLSKPPGSGIVENNQQDEPSLGKSKNETTTTTTDNLDKSLEDEFNSMMKEVQTQDPQLASQLKDFVQELKNEQGSSTTTTTTTTDPLIDHKEQSLVNKNFDEIMSDTINRLKNSGETVDQQIKEEQKVGGDPISQLLAQLGDLNLEGEDGDNDDEAGGFGNVLMDMLSQLTSKNVLYEPLKDLHSKFPLWLVENKLIIPTEEHENYSKQYFLIDEIIVKFEEPNYDDKLDCIFINNKLEQLQNLGMPPEEIMNSELGDIPGFNSNKDNNDEFDNEDLPKEVERELEEGCKQA